MRIEKDTTHEDQMRREMPIFNVNHILVFVPSIVVIILLLVIGRIISVGFISVQSLSTVFMTGSLLAFATIGQSIAMMSGNNGIDLSIGAIMSMTALVGPMLPMNNHAQYFMAIFLIILLGAFFGFINGLGIQLFNIPPLIMTLIMSNVIYGWTYYTTRGRMANETARILDNVARPVIPSFPLLRMLTLVCIIIVIIFESVLRRSRVGRILVITGDNPKAAHICGIKVKFVAVLAYIVSGGISAFAGLMLVGYTGSAIIKMADGYTLLSIAAAIIGGTSISGGKGSFVGGALGALVLMILNNILQVLNMPEGVRYVIQGTLLTIILLANTRSAKLRQ
jgi:ribose transport system permease protein